MNNFQSKMNKQTVFQGYFMGQWPGGIRTFNLLTYGFLSWALAIVLSILCLFFSPMSIIGSCCFEGPITVPTVHSQESNPTSLKVHTSNKQCPMSCKTVIHLNRLIMYRILVNMNNPIWLKSTSSYWKYSIKSTINFFSAATLLSPFKTNYRLNTFMPQSRNLNFIRKKNPNMDCLIKRTKKTDENLAGNFKKISPPLKFELHPFFPTWSV